MKKATFLLLSVFLLGSMYFSPSIAARSMDSAETQTTSDNPQTSGQPGVTDAVSKTQENNQPGVAEGPKKSVQSLLLELKKKVDKLPKNKERGKDVNQLLADIGQVEKQLNKVEPADIGAIENIRQQIAVFRGRYESLSKPLDSVSLQTNQPTENDPKKPIQDRIKNLKTKVSNLVKDSQKKAKATEILNDIDKIALDLSKADPTDAALLKGIDDEVNALSIRYEQLAREEGSQSFTFWEWLIFGVVGLIVLGGIGVGIYFLWKYKEQKKAELQSSFNGLKARDRELGTKLDGFQKVVTDLSQQVAQQKAEILKLKQGLANQPPGSSSFSPQPLDVPREQPRFPVAVDDYLARVGQGRRSVKYDYKERLLVLDPTDEGNLLLVQDEGRLYVVPSFTTFSTKSDYTTYLERYYNCVKPMAGTIWIRQPAAVTESDSGWQLAAMGDLEVR